MKLTKIALVMACIGLLSACDGALGGRNGNVDQQPSTDASNPSSVGYFNQTIGDRVLFLVDQSTLTPEATQILDAQANWLLEYTQYTATIEGHADEQGTREHNLALGARRASSVKNYLVSRGVADNRVETITYGKERPLEICSNEACWSKNRRAVTLVASGLGA